MMRENLGVRVLFVSVTVFTQVDCSERSSPSVDARVEERTLPSSARTTIVPLIDQGHWRAYPADQDPLGDHQPSIVDCGPAGYYVEPDLFVDPLLEIDTTYCNYTLLEHPASHAVAAGDTVRFELRHYDLVAPEPARAHIAWVFQDALEWETLLPIPSSAKAEHFEWMARHALAEGDPIRLHLHNHGQNTWQIVKLEAVVSGDDTTLP
jgi:hypothetical protein